MKIIFSLSQGNIERTIKWNNKEKKKKVIGARPIEKNIFWKEIFRFPPYYIVWEILENA